MDSFAQLDGVGSDDHFFHRAGLDPEEPLAFDQLVEGQRVHFEVEASPKGPRAHRVRVVADHEDVA